MKLKAVLHPKLIKALSVIAVTSLCVSAAAQPTGPATPERRDLTKAIKDIKLPPGFKIEVYADNILNARSLNLSPNGTLFVGSHATGNGQVYAVVDSNNDKRADKIHVLDKGLNIPNGVVYRDGSLYVAEISRILRYDNIEASLNNPPEPVVVYDQYPDDFLHGWKYINFGPDGKLYVPVGAPCNICEPDEKHANITRINADGSGYEVFAKGIRNSVGFDWHPQTKEMWFTDNGRDEWGDDRPPEELNRAPAAGLNFGYPYRYGKDLVDDGFKTTLKASDFTPAAWEFPAHNACLGVQFYTGNSFPAEYKNDILVACRGSWNRSVPDGYRIMRAHLENNQVVSAEVFASGWLQGNSYWGRPVDMEVMPDGSLLVSDDFANAIYRISYQP